MVCRKETINVTLSHDCDTLQLNNASKLCVRNDIVYQQTKQKTKQQQQQQQKTNKTKMGVGGGRGAGAA